MIKNQQIRAVPEALITFKGSICAVQIREGSPPGTGCRAQWNRDTGDFESVGQQFSTVENFATPCSDHSVARQTNKIVLEPLKIKLSAIVLEILLEHSQTALIQLTTKLGPNRLRGLTPAKQQWITTEL